MTGRLLVRLRWGVVLVLPVVFVLSALTTPLASAATRQRPSSPRHLRAVPGENNAIVTFSAPSDGGARITDYYIKVYPRSSDDSAIRRCRSTRCEVLGLSDSLAYYFEVAAVNRFGVGPYSDGSNIVSPRPSTRANATITYVANSANAAGAMASETEPYDTSADLTINAFTRPGYVFKNWSTTPNGTGTTFTNGELVKFTGNITLYAIWSVSADLVTVTFNANSSNATGAMAPEIEPYGVATTLNGNSFANSGYSFEGWSLSPTGTATYSNGESVAFTSANVDLYAVWAANLATFSGRTTPNWAGYVLPSATNSAVFTYVSGEWTVPTLNCADTPNNKSASWVGTGGFGWATGETSGALLQTGTEDDCINGVQADSGWFEIYPSTPNTQETFRGFQVSPGDTMLAEVALSTSDQWITVIENLSTGLEGVFAVGNSWDVQRIGTNDLVGGIQGNATGTSYVGGDSAEWITEDTGVAYSSQNYPFANFGTVVFSNLKTDLSSWTLPNSDAVEIVQSGNVLAIPGPVNNDGFTIAYTGT